MAEYIKREEVYQYLDNEVEWNVNQDRLYTLEVISDFPAADVAPVVRAKWEPSDPICPVCGKSKFNGLDADIWADWQPKYCPNCGALMKEDEHEAD